jgi:sugar lactone lactonase YvrE
MTVAAHESERGDGEHDRRDGEDGRASAQAEAAAAEYWPQVEALSAYVAQVGESPVWDERGQQLYWVDIEGHRLLQWASADRLTRHWQFDREVCSMGLGTDASLVVALRDGVYRFDPASGAAGLIVALESDCPTRRLNDGKVGPDGAFWVGSMDERAVKEAVASLYRVDGAGRAQRVGVPVKVSNGLGFSPDGRYVYHSDSRGPWIVRYPYDAASANLGAAQPWVTLQAGWGRPDGAAVDAAGCYWSCGIDAGRINRFSPAGRLLEVYHLPVSHPTMCCFGGADYTTLFVTSLLPPDAALAAAQPLAGRLFSFKVAAAGLPAARFDMQQAGALAARSAPLHALESVHER